MAHPDITIDYTNGSSADTTTFALTNAVFNPARWIQTYGAGNVVMVDAGGVSRTYTCTGSEVLVGEWGAFTSTTCTRIRVGTSQPAPQPFPFPTAVNLAGGASSVTGILPASQVQDWVDAATVYTTAFTALVNVLAPFNFQLTGNITFPKITAALNGLSIGLINVGTGATAVTLVGTGTDSVGPVAVSTTGATAAAPASLKSQRYTPNITLGQWIPSV